MCIGCPLWQLCRRMFFSILHMHLRSWCILPPRCYVLNSPFHWHFCCNLAPNQPLAGIELEKIGFGAFFALELHEKDGELSCSFKGFWLVHVGAVYAGTPRDIFGMLTPASVVHVACLLLTTCNNKLDVFFLRQALQSPRITCLRNNLW